MNIKKTVVNEKEYSKGLAIIGTVSAVFVLAVVAIMGFIMGTVNKVSGAVLKGELKSYAETVQQTLNIHIQHNFDTMTGIAISVASLDGLDSGEEERIIRNINQNNGFKQMGYADKNGIANIYDVNGSVYEHNYYKDEFFQKALSGKNSIKDTMKDPSGEDRIVCYAVPVYRDGNVVGVLVAADDASKFSSIINSEKWGHEGYNNIVNKNGDFIIRGENPDIPDSAMSVFELGDFTDGEKQEFYEVIENNGGDYEYTSNCSNYAYVLPIYDIEWYLISSLSERFLLGSFSQRIHPILMCFAVFIGAFTFFITYNLIASKKRYNEQKMLREENETALAQSGNWLMRYDIEKHILYNIGTGNDNVELPDVWRDFPETLPDYGIAEESLEDFVNFFKDMRAKIPSGSVDFKYIDKEGNVFWHHGDYTLKEEGNGKKAKYVYSIVSFYDNTERYNQKRASEKRLNDIMFLARDCDFYFECNTQNRIIERVRAVAPDAHAANNVLGRSLDEVLEKEWRPLISADDYDAVKEFLDIDRLVLLNIKGVEVDSVGFRLAKAGDNVDWRNLEVRFIPATRTKPLKIFAVFRDVSEYEELLYKATTDEYTGVLSREATMQKIEAFLLSEGKEGTHALVMFDLDNLKAINDSLGHQAGDEALRRTAETMQSSFSDDGIVGRIGGDEFFVLAKNIKCESISLKVKELLSNLQFVFAANGRQIVSSVSAGISVYRGDEKPQKTLKKLYSEADAALYKSKSSGKGIYSFYNDLDTIFSSSATAFNKNETISLNLQSLLNNLAAGISIYHGVNENEIYPMFCNEGYLELVGLTQDQFYTHMNKNLLYGVHPDDMEGLRNRFTEAYYDRKPMQHTFRLRSSDTEFRWVTIFGNFRFFDDNSFDVYFIYSDAE